MKPLLWSFATKKALDFGQYIHPGKPSLKIEQTAAQAPDAEFYKFGLSITNTCPLMHKAARYNKGAQGAFSHSQ